MDTVFLPKSSAMRSGFIIDSVSVFAMLRIFWLSVELLFPTKLSAIGVTNLAQRMLEQSRNVEAHLATHKQDASQD
jgi:glutaredoxin 2